MSLERGRINHSQPVIRGVFFVIGSFLLGVMNSST